MRSGVEKRKQDKKTNPAGSIAKRVSLWEEENNDAGWAKMEERQTNARLTLLEG